MNLHSLSNSKGARQSRTRLGRGHGSGKGKTSGKGHKGQMARKGASHKAGFEGGQMTLIRRLPKRGFKNPVRKVYAPVNVGDLARFEDGTEVTPELLRSVGLVNGPADGVKILGKGSLERKLVVNANAFSVGGRNKVEAAGGTCNIVSK